MIIGIAETAKITSSNRLIIRNINLSLLSFSVKFLNFSENIFNFETNRLLNRIVIVMSTILFVNILYILMCAKLYEKCSAKGIDTTNNANAGVGKPINSVFWSVILKIDNLIAEKTIIKNDTNGKKECSPEIFIKLYIINVGARPKLTRSENESICFPNSDWAFNKRATKPSKKSNIEARIINPAEIYNNSGIFKEINIEIVPLKILSDVIAFGIISLFISRIMDLGCFFSYISFN